MNIKSFFTKIIDVVVSGAKKIFELVMDANVTSIAKAGLFIGSVVVGYVLTTKVMKSNYNHMKDTSNMSPVDSALALNFTDKRNTSKINPILAEVKKTLSSKKINKKSKKIDRKKIENTLNYLKNKTVKVGSYGSDILSELEKFEKDMKEIEINSLHDEFYENNFALRQAWNNA